MRRTFPYNIARFTTPGTAAHEDLLEARKWVRTAIAAGKIPLISFDRCRFKSPEAAGTDRAFCDGVPSYDDYTASIRAFFSDAADANPETPELSSVRVFTPWNEPNQGLRAASAYQPPNDEDRQPLAYIYNGAARDATMGTSGAFRAGRFWRYLDFKCRETAPDRCSVAGGDFLDSDLGPTFGARYLAQYKEGMGRKPKFWAWHAYRDGAAAASIPDSQASRRWTRLRAFVRATAPTDGSAAPAIWLTKQGPVWRRKTGPTGMTDNDAARIIRRYTSSAWTVSGRVSRFYLYQMVGEITWDSGLKDWEVAGFPRRPLSYTAYCRRTDPNRTC